MAGPSRLQEGNGLLRRHEAEHLQVVDRRQIQTLHSLQRTRDARRRAQRADEHLQRRNGGGTADQEEENALRATEEGAIDITRRALLLNRTGRPAHHARGHRNRDILRHGIRDVEDGVRRCIDCNWEIENGTCLHW